MRSARAWYSSVDVVEGRIVVLGSRPGGGPGVGPKHLSYRILKMRIVRRRRWDLNIRCGRTDAGGVNADIVRHADMPWLVIVDVYPLPFRDGAFDSVLCSHTLEHVDDPDAFYRELGRVGRSVTVMVPPLWDVSAALNLLEHRWLFVTLRKEHHALPRHVPPPRTHGRAPLWPAVARLA